MKLIAGLGNPGREYAETRHNLGFQVVESFVEACKVKFPAKNTGSGWRKSGNHEAAEVFFDETKLKVIKPLTFMNRSGEAVGEMMRFYKVSPADLLVAHDELDLPFGAVRLKAGGGDAGNNGLKSITECLGTGEYNRLRLGIGKPEGTDGRDGAAWVLSKFSSEERKSLPEMIDRACAAIGEYLERGIKAAQNKFNASDRAI